MTNASSNGVKKLNCPGCQRPIAAGTSICPHCDYIVDDSFLSGAGSSEVDSDASDEGDRTVIANAPTPVQRNVRPKSSGQAPLKVGPVPDDFEHFDDFADGEEADRTQIRSEEEVKSEQIRSRSPSRERVRSLRPEDFEPVPPSPTVTAAPRPSLVPPALPPKRVAAPADELFAQARELVSSLSGTDRAVAFSASLILLDAFLPWKETRSDGEVMGLLSLAAPAVLAAFLVLGSVIVRVRHLMPKLDPILPWLAQLCFSGFGTVWSLLFLRLSWVGGPTVGVTPSSLAPVSVPAAGAYIGLIGFLVCLGATVWGLKKKPS